MTGAIAATLTDQDIADLTAYFGSLSSDITSGASVCILNAVSYAEMRAAKIALCAGVGKRCADLAEIGIVVVLDDEHPQRSIS